MWKVAHSRRFSSTHSAVRAKTSLRSSSKPRTNEPLNWITHSVRHPQPVGCQKAETTAIMAPASRNQAGGCQEAVAWQDRTARPRILGVVILISCSVALQQASAFYITKNTRPKLYAVAEH